MRRWFGITLGVVFVAACATGDERQSGSDDDDGGVGGSGAATTTTTGSGAGTTTGVGGTATTTSTTAATTTSTATTTTTTSTATTTTSGGGGTCYAGFGSCNPLDPTSCASGEACDVSNVNDFQCFPPPNQVPEGGACDQSLGPYCQHGLTCLGGTSCRRFCCTNADCVTGTCQFFESFGTINVSLCM